MTRALERLRCTACGRPSLAGDARAWTREEVVPDAVTCTSCGATFPAIWGTPFVGHYEHEDVLGLIEIAANAREENTYASRSEIERLERLLQHYHAARDKDAFLAGCSDDFAHAPWFGNRYGEYASFRRLADRIDLRGRDVLDVGAGTGYDAWRLVQAGGRVTALEYNPMLIRRGSNVVPEARWIGGFAHVLPFESGSFDVVCCNAALHHMRDVPTAMREMLRVLRRDGYLVTTGDPFRADTSDEEHVLDVFDTHPDVLLGVNESIPRFAELVEALEANSRSLDVTFLTIVGRRATPGTLKRLVGLRHWNGRLLRRLATGGEDLWPFSSRAWLSAASGNLSIRARVRRPLPLEATTQADVALRADEYARVLSNHDAALARLVPLLPDRYVDREFPGSRQSKFELLNGWRKPKPGGDARTGYRRARWFLTRGANVSTLRFDARSAKGNPATLRAYVSGRPAASVGLHDRWSDVAVPLADVPPGSRFVCELRFEPANADESDFDALCFDIRQRRFA